MSNLPKVSSNSPKFLIKVGTNAGPSCVGPIIAAPISDIPCGKKDKSFSSVKERSKKINILYKLIEKKIKKKNNKELVRVLKKNDIPHGVLNTLENLKKDKHLKKVDFFRNYYHPTEGKLLIPDTGIKIDNKSLPIRYHQPNLGEQSKEILEELGYTKKEIDNILN